MLHGKFGVPYFTLMLSVCTALALAAPAFGQISTASINGTVTDATGAVIPNAQVVLTNVATGVRQRVESNTVGNYRITNIQPGNYTLEASKEGFRKAVIPPFNLAVNQNATIDISLEIGALTETVTVEATGAELQASSSELGAAVQEKQVVDLPLNGRNFTQLLALTPGVAPVSVAQNSGGFTASPVGQFQFPSVNGQTNRSNLFYLDGVLNQGQFVSTYAVPPIIDAVQEFKVNSHHDDTEFGGVLGGVVNVVSKSGTNEYHGSAWEFFRNDELDARNFFRNQVTPQKWNQFGATLGGPVKKNKVFFFLGWQGFELRRPQDTLFRVPTEANLNGDLSDEPRQIFNPFSTRPDPGQEGAFIRDPFPNNQIPGQLLDQGMVTLARTLLPSPIVTNVGNRNALNFGNFEQSQHEFTAKVDYTINDSNFVWFRWSGIIQDNEGPAPIQAAQDITELRGKNIAGSWTQTIDPTSVIQVSFGRARLEDNLFRRLRDNVPGDLAQQIGCVSTFCDQFNFGDPLLASFNVNDFFSTGGEVNTLNDPSSGTNNFNAKYQKVFGNHTLKFGGGYSSFGFEAFLENASVGFAIQQTRDPQAPAGATGSSLGSFLLGVPDNAGRRNVHETLRHGGVWNAFIHDSWKATPKLTINMGLRYDRTFIPPFGQEEVVGQQGSPETGNLDLLRGIFILQRKPPPCNVRGRAPCIPTPDGSLPEHVIVDPREKIWHDTRLNFQPRMGIAYRLTENTVIRTGFGVFFDNWSSITQLAQNFEGAWPDVGQQLAQNMNLPTAQNPTPSVRANNPFPGGLFPAPTPFDTLLWFADPFFENPYSLQWNFGLQHQLSRSTTVQANYVGSGSRRLSVGGFFNTAVEPGPGPISPRTPFPHAQQSFFDRSWGSSNYNAFQFLLNRRFSEGLALQFSYTYSKSIDFGCSGKFGVEGCSIQNPFDLGRERSVSAFDITEVAVVNWVWELPFGPGKRFDPGNKVLSAIVGGWQFNGIATFRSGQPFTVSVSGDLPNTGNAGNFTRPNIAGDPELIEPTAQEFFNTSAFVSPGPFAFGNAGRNILRSDGVDNYDLSVFRRFSLSKLREQMQLEFRAEFFNAFNSAVFGIPNANVDDTQFGQVTSTVGTNPERQIQFSLKLLF